MLVFNKTCTGQMSLSMIVIVFSFMNRTTVASNGKRHISLVVKYRCPIMSADSFTIWSHQGLSRLQR